MTDEQRKLTYLRDNVEQLQERSSSLQSLLHTVQNSNAEDAAEVFRRLRTGTDIQVVADQVQAGQLLSGVGMRDQDRKLGCFRSELRLYLYLYPEHAQRSTAWGTFRAAQSDQIVNILVELDDDASMEVVRRLRNRDDPASILDDVHNGNLTPPPSHLPVMRHSAIVDGNPPTIEAGFGMIGVEDIDKIPARKPGAGFVDSQIEHSWTTVTKDTEFVEHLLTLYFTWQHCVFQNFPQHLFRADMINGRTKYCSVSLVNAICAAGCLLSSREKARQDRGDGQTLVSSFYDMAKGQIDRDDLTCITTISALYLLSYVDGTRANLSSLWMLSGRSVVMAVDVGIYLRRKERVESGSASEEEEYSKEELARCHSFWGCFHIDTYGIPLLFY